MNKDASISKYVSVTIILRKILTFFSLCKVHAEHSLRKWLEHQYNPTEKPILTQHFTIEDW